MDAARSTVIAAELGRQHPGSEHGRPATGLAVAAEPARRRLLAGLAALGLAVFGTGCDRRLPLVASPAATPRPSEPAELPPAEPPEAPGIPVGVTFGRVVSLDGVTVERDAVRPGEYLRIWLHWQLVAAAQEDLRSIGRLVASGGRVVASEDDQIGRRRRFLSRWQVGERSVDEMRLRIAQGMSPGEYSLVVGVLRPDNQTAVPLTTRVPAGSTWQEDGIVVGAIEVVTG